jgi:hypothetical protein
MTMRRSPAAVAAATARAWNAVQVVEAVGAWFATRAREIARLRAEGAGRAGEQAQHDQHASHNLDDGGDAEQAQEFLLAGRSIRRKAEQLNDAMTKKKQASFARSVDNRHILRHRASRQPPRRRALRSTEPLPPTSA